jgi:hypothetical protein
MAQSPDALSIQKWRASDARRRQPMGAFGCLRLDRRGSLIGFAILKDRRIAALPIRIPAFMLATELPMIHKPWST